MDSRVPVKALMRPKTDQIPIAGRYKAGGATHLAAKANRITTRPRTVLSVQLGIKAPNMVKYRIPAHALE